MDDKYEGTCDSGVILNCDKNGDDPQKKLTWFNGKGTLFANCPVCAKEKKDEAEELERKRREEEEKARWKRAQQRAGVTPRNAEMRFKNHLTETPEQKHVHDVCNSYAKRIYDGEQVESMIITGRVGTGKTMIATCMINALYKSKRVLIVKLADMLRYIKGAYQSGAEYTEFQAIDKFAGYDLLILDEVGASRETDNDKLLIFDVIDGRYQNMLPTVIISNLNIDGIKEVLGDRVVDRLRDGGGKMIGCNWDSYRR